jgi:receptor-type tyrosine-protein phosphatase beta
MSSFVCLQVDSISHHIASGQPLEVTQTIAPHPVTEIQPILDAENITLQWPRPDGRIGTVILHKLRIQQR